jgi:hypothetical protein
MGGLRGGTLNAAPQGNPGTPGDPGSNGPNGSQGLPTIVYQTP